MDRKRRKRMPNEEWVNPHDPEAEITPLKDGRTALAYGSRMPDYSNRKTKFASRFDRPVASDYRVRGTFSELCR